MSEDGQSNVTNIQSAARRRKKTPLPLPPETPDEIFVAYKKASEWVHRRGMFPIEATADLIKTFGYDLSYNEVLCRPEVNGKPADEDLEATLVSMFRELRTLHEEELPSLKYYSRRTSVTDGITWSFCRHRYDPIRQWFLKLSAIPARPRAFSLDDYGNVERDEHGLAVSVPAIAMEELPLELRPFERLCTYFGDDQGNVRAFLYRWMLGCVGRVLDGFQNYTLVLKGVQGAGKSTFARWLCSIGEQYYQEGEINPFDKDHKLRLGQRFIICADEFNPSLMKRSERRALKGYLSQETITERPPYAHYNRFLKRTANIIATTNDATFLDDPTGNRRYLVLDLTRLDHAYATDLNAELVWADIVQRYLYGLRGTPGSDLATGSDAYGRERPFLTSDEKAAQEEMNAGVERVDTIEEVLDEIVRFKPGAFTPRSTVNKRVRHRLEIRGDVTKMDNLSNRIQQILVTKWSRNHPIRLKKNVVQGYEGIIID